MQNPAAVFPHLDVRYIQYPDDINLTRFFTKMADASAKVQTRYVMQADNDDFLVPSGIDWCMRFLEQSSDFASCGGGVAGFSLHAPSDATLPHVVGPIERLTFRYNNNSYYLPHDFSSPSIAKRIENGFSGSYALYYNVFRSEALATICDELADLDFSDLYIHETYFGMRAKSLGKSKLDGTCISYLRQTGTSLYAEQRKDWVGHLLRSRFNSDFATMVDRMAHIVAAADQIDTEAFAEDIRRLYAERLREDLRMSYGSLPPRPAYHPKSLIKASLRALSLGRVLDAYRRAAERRRGRPARLRRIASRDREIMFNSLRACGAADSYLAAFQKDLAGVEETLEGDEFLRFLQERVPELLPAPTDKCKVNDGRSGRKIAQLRRVDPR
jgi:glycosyltransferase domain-containing protein